MQVGKTVQLITNFIGGFTIAFIRGWQLALVMVSVIPLLVVAGATISRFMSQMAARGQSAYANAANVVEQTIGSIRTVYIIQYSITWKDDFSLNFEIVVSLGCVVYG